MTAELHPFPLYKSPVPTISASDMQCVFDIAQNEYHIDHVKISESAGLALARVGLERYYRPGIAGSVVVFAGSADNSLAALVAACRWKVWGLDVEVCLSVKENSSRLGADILAELRILGAMGVEICSDIQKSMDNESVIIIDALIGSDLKGYPKGKTAEMIRFANDHAAPILSFDIPSGLHPDTGRAYEPTIRADATVTIGLPQKGMHTKDGHTFCGAVYLADVSIPVQVFSKCKIEVPELYGTRDIVLLSN